MDLLELLISHDKDGTIIDVHKYASYNVTYSNSEWFGFIVVQKIYLQSSMASTIGITETYLGSVYLM